MDILRGKGISCPWVPRLSGTPFLTPHLDTAPLNPPFWGPGQRVCTPLPPSLLLAQQDPSFLAGCSSVPWPQLHLNSEKWKTIFSFFSERKQMHQESGRKFSGGNWLVMIHVRDANLFSIQAAETQERSQAVSAQHPKSHI